MCWKVLRWCLFLLPAEQAHRWVLGAGQVVCSLSLLSSLLRWGFGGAAGFRAVKVMGIMFRNPLGIAAGMDKDACYLNLWDTLGFGFVEVGTVTPRPQVGNPRPRLFRSIKERSLINRMGFNNQGAQQLRKRLAHKPSGLVVGINIGKMRDTPLAEATKDYIACLEVLQTVGDYFVINISSPNTPALRELQHKQWLYDFLNPILAYCAQIRLKQPILVKIGPDMGKEALDNLLSIVQQLKIQGLVVTNTLPCPEGGISGALLQVQANATLRYLKQQAPTLTYIGVGGISAPAHAIEKRRIGADLIQVYTGLVYQGPRLVGQILGAWEKA